LLRNYNSFVNGYLEKHSFCERLIAELVSADSFLILVIPCHDEPELLTTLQSLKECDTTESVVEVIVVINSGEHDKQEVLERNKKTYREAKEWIKQNSEAKLRFHLIDVNKLPKKHAGVGLARKIGMDEAVRRFEDINRQDGVIVCLDADCTVEQDYLAEIEKHFFKNSKVTGCSICFEHPLEGDAFSKEIYEGIMNYELFLRYYCLSLSYCNFPYPFETIGSCMAVRSSVYQKQGGMNRRKAGEDFYFLHKIFPLGNFTTLNSTKVIPSPRPSHRVPFGTGSAIQKYLATQNESYSLYNIQSFVDLKSFFQLIPSFYKNANFHSVPTSVQKFLGEEGFNNKLKEIQQYSTTEKVFVKRFFNWFDGFMVLKFIHFSRDNFYPNMEIADAAKELLRLQNVLYDTNISKKDLLLLYRRLEREYATPSAPAQYSYPE
jgi:hypothetical protein